MVTVIPTPSNRPSVSSWKLCVLTRREVVRELVLERAHGRVQRLVQQLLAIDLAVVVALDRVDRLLVEAAVGVGDKRFAREARQRVGMTPEPDAQDERDRYEDEEESDPWSAAATHYGTSRYRAILSVPYAAQARTRRARGRRVDRPALGTQVGEMQAPAGLVAGVGGARGEREPRTWIEYLDAQDAVRTWIRDLDVAVLVPRARPRWRPARTRAGGRRRARPGSSTSERTRSSISRARAGAESDFGNVSE